MDKIKEILSKFLPNVPFDKKLHFLAGLLIALIMGFIIDPITGIGVSIIAGIGKEAWDYTDYGKFDIVDMIATWIGGACGFALVSLVNYWKG